MSNVNLREHCARSSEKIAFAPQRCIPWLLTVVLLGLVPVMARAGDQIPADVLKKVKKSTVYLRVTLADGRVVEGSGFVAGASVVVTNGHVLGMLSPEGRKPQKIEVVVDSGEVGQKVYAGQLSQVDPAYDLAAVLVPGQGLPAPLPLAQAKNLLETQTL
jgi:hypothetical protein